MADQKTEPATPKKLRTARQRGEVARSRDLTSVVVVGVAVAVLYGMGGGFIRELGDLFRVAIDASGRADFAAMALVGSRGATVLMTMCAPMLAAAVAASLGIGFLQVGPVFSLAPTEPKLNRLDPVRGFKNLMSGKQLFELGKAIAKIAAILGFAGWVCMTNAPSLASLARGDIERVLGGAVRVSSVIALEVLAFMALLAVVDVLYQRWAFQQGQRMSKDEVRREQKESEGDPHAKQHRERMHREILEHNILENVRRADVVVVNPTHIAVALRYDESSDQEAPEVVAKGQAELAQRIREVALQEGIPVMQDVPLAQALATLEIGDEIPIALYEAVAVVLRSAWDERDAGSKAERS